METEKYNLKKNVIKFIRSKKYSSMDSHGLARQFEVDDQGFDEFCKMLNNLEVEGEIIKIKKDQYACPKKLQMVVGTLECKPDGYGFVLPACKDIKNDVFVTVENMGGAMHDDLVVVQLPFKKHVKKKKDGRSHKLGSGKIVDILKRSNDSVIGILKKSRKLNYVVPDNAALVKDIYVVDEDLNGAEIDDKVIVKIIQWPTRHLHPEGEVTKILGKEDDPGVDIQSVIYQFKLPNTFSDDTNREAANVSETISDEEYKNRVDLRKETIITIDPEDAKDFDDAISLKRAGDNWILGVHIADVSYYVKPGTHIDDEARKRGTSVYFPGEVIPMLPEKLSNGICSLKQGEDRLTKTVFFTYDRKGMLLGTEIRNSVICVTKRFSYKEVTQLLEQADKDAGSITSINNDLLDLLLNTRNLAQILFIKRMARGSIELDLPEVDLKLNEDGDIVSVEKCVKDVSHSMIEEFMLAANEAVACYTGKHRLRCFYRLHEEPDEETMQDFAYFIKGLKKKKINPFDRKQLQAILDDVNGEPEAYAVNLMLLRSFKRAIYSTKEHHHYALALEDYTHFTSPIRRYPDLVVHRALDNHFAQMAESDDEMAVKEVYTELANHCSTTERRAEEAEREITKMKLIRHMGDRVLEDMDGIITGVEEYGFFVQLMENLLEGLVHVSTLTDDFYELDKKNMTLIGTRRKKVFRIGDKIKVKICKVDKIKKQVDFKVVM